MKKIFTLILAAAVIFSCDGIDRYPDATFDNAGLSYIWDENAMPEIIINLKVKSFLSKTLVL